MITVIYAFMDYGLEKCEDLKLKVFVALAIVVAGLFSGFGVGNVKALAIEIRITTDTAHQRYPAIYGDIIVWEDWRNMVSAGSDIWMYDLSTGTETRITTNTHNQEHPAIYGDRIVWEDGRNMATGGWWDIYMYDLSTGTETRITNDSTLQVWPEIYGDRIVWMEERNWATAGWDIWMYDLSTETKTRIANDTVWSPKIAIYDDRIVWDDNRNAMTASEDIYMYDLSTGTETRITNNTAMQYLPAIYGDIIAWTDFRNDATASTDIYMYDLSTGTETRITNNTDYQGFPAIYGDHIVWSDGRSGAVGIYMYDLSTGTETRMTTGAGVPAIYGDRIVWEDSRNMATAGWDIYMADLSSVAPEPPPPSDPIVQTENVKTIVADYSQIPRSDFDGATDRVKDNRRSSLLNRLDAVIIDIETAMASTKPSTQKTAYKSAIDQLNSILEKTDGCSQRGTPDTEGSDYTQDWITTYESQAKIDPLIRALIITIQTLLAQIPQK